MIPTQYRITIAGKTGTPGASTDGFIDATKTEQYMAAGSAPTTYVKSVAKERANVRFKFLREQLQLEANIYIDDIVATGADANTQATSFVFTITAERGDSVLFTRDETNGNAELHGIDAVKRMIARALTETRTVNGDMYDPTMSSTDTSNGVERAPAARRGTRVETLLVAGLYSNLTDAAASVTVAPL